MQSHEQVPDANTIINCFATISNHNSSSHSRKEADQRLLSFDHHTVPFIISLLEILEKGQSFEMALKALVYFCNVIKRTWLIRKVSK